MSRYEYDDYEDLSDTEWDEATEELLAEYQRQTEALYQVPDAVPDEDGLITLPVVFLRDAVVYPRMLAPIFVDEELSVPAIEAARAHGTTVLTFPLYDPEVARPRKGDIFPIGVEAAVGRPLTLPDGQRSALMQGRRRVRLVRVVRWKPFVVAQAVPLPPQEATDRETEALLRNALRLLQRMAELSSTVPEEAYLFALNIDSPDWAADFISTTLAPDWGHQLEILSTLSPKERLRKVLDWLAQEVDVLELEDEIHHRVQSEMDRSQREAYLREQMRAIQSELGEGDFWQRELNELRQRIEKADLPEEPRKVALREWERLSQLPPMSPEVGIVRTYIDWILELPWTERTEGNLDLAHARELARLMVSIGRHAGREVRAVLSQMDEPLGRAVGNAIEVREAIATLRGEGPGDLTELSLALAREALEAAGEDPARAEEVWKSGAALEKLRAFVAAQGGDARVVDEPERLELAPDVYELRAEASGVVTELDAYRVGLAVLRLGGGRERKGDAIDHGVGVRLAKKVGDRVAEGDILATVFHRAGRGLEESSQRLKEAYRIGQRASVPPLILEVVA